MGPEYFLLYLPEPSLDTNVSQGKLKHSELDVSKHSFNWIYS